MRIQISSNKIVRCMRYLAVYLLLLASSGFHIYAQGYHVPLMLVAALFFFLLSGKRIDVRLLTILIATIVLVIVSGLINSETIRNIMLPAIDLFCGALIAFGALSSKKKGEFIEIYRHVMLFLAIGSVICFAVGAVANTLFRVFPLFAQGRHEAYFTGVSFVYKSRQYLQYRNLGIFWEPGAYQTYLILAMIMEDRVAHKHKLRNLLILSVTMLTTVSTTGIICLLLFWVVYVCKNENRKSSLLITLILVLCIFIVVAYPEILPDQLRFGLIEKISDVLSGDQELATVQTRVDSVMYPLRAFWEHPLFGVSKTGMAQWSQITGHRMNTCTPVNWFAHYGIFMGLLLLIGFYQFFVKIGRKRWIGVCMLLIFLVSISTEAFNYCCTLVCFAFMGSSGKKDLLPGGNNDENTSG